LRAEEAIVEVDLVVVGAGPTGLYSAYYAGFRGLRSAIIDSLPEPGGQIAAMYPAKLIYDVAGFPAVKGRELVTALLAQAEAYSPEWLLGRSATSLERLADGRLRLTTTYTGHHVLVIGGGDITEYRGKVRLISVGFGEAALAVNNAVVAGDPTARLFPGHSSETAA
jgi:ferredoxin/flavodoxin---NADP+ reductase